MSDKITNSIESAVKSLKERWSEFSNLEYRVVEDKTETLTDFTFWDLTFPALEIRKIRLGLRYENEEEQFVYVAFLPQSSGNNYYGQLGLSKLVQKGLFGDRSYALSQVDINMIGKPTIIIYRNDIFTLPENEGNNIFEHELRQVIIMNYWRKFTDTPLNARESYILWEAAAGITDASERYSRLKDNKNYIYDLLSDSQTSVRETIRPSVKIGTLFTENSAFLQMFALGEYLRNEKGITNLKDFLSTPKEKIIEYSRQI